MADLTLNINETVAIEDELRRNARSVISDMLISTGDMTEDEFIAIAEAGAPPGYAKFVPFIDGDHDHQKALFKSVMTSNGSSKLRLTGLEVDIDLPDVYDRGAKTIPSAAAVSVTYNRPFYHVSEVVATIKGGTVVAVPIVRNITNTGFDVELRDTSNALVAGEVSWSAKGY